jgi:hypothetical protein
METAKPKTLGDFPQFVINDVRPGVTSDDGYQLFEIEASFDPILERRFDEMMEGVGVQWFWLLFSERSCLTPMLKSFDKQTKTVILSCYEKEEPRIIGLTLPYLSPYWQAFHVWMVLDPNWGWERKQFQGIDAVTEDYEAEEVSFVDGREVKIWSKLQPAGMDTGQSRHYPASDQTSPVRSGTRLVPGGWGHEHCELCNKHIDAGMVGYCDPGERWMCEVCYDRYVIPRDLAFVGEL